jgi:hypothetical protein
VESGPNLSPNTAAAPRRILTGFPILPRADVRAPIEGRITAEGSVEVKTSIGCPAALHRPIMKARKPGRRLFELTEWKVERIHIR